MTSEQAATPDATGTLIPGETADILLQTVLNDVLHVDQYRSTDSETIRRIGNVLLFTCSIGGTNAEAEVFANNAVARVEFFRRAADMQAMEAEAKAEWEGGE